jgi:pyruvate/2-oxoglutarate dehydrogenase complex dihydrolipoamide acyltransferase (E2) component
MERLLLPRLGQTMEEGEISSWFVSQGDAFDVGDELYEVENEKSSVPVEATVRGRIGRLLVPAGTVVSVGETLAVILEGAEEASESAIDAFLAGAPAAAPTPAASPPAPDEPARPSTQPRVSARTQLSGVPLRMATVLAESWSATPQFQQVVLVDASELARRRSALAPRLAELGAGRLTYNDLLVDAVTRAAVEQPAVNTSYQDGELVRYLDVNVALAIGTERGLVAPVVHASQELTLGERVARTRELAERARVNALTPEDLAGATITLSNLGMHGVDTGFALVTRPQAAIVFAGSIAPRPMVVDDAVVARPSLYMSVTYDHRALDGATAAGFLASLRQQLERPEAAPEV